MCICVSLSAYVTLFCLFMPKVSIILLHPDKNVRKLTMNSATYRRPFKPSIPQASASAEGRINAPPTTSATYNGNPTDLGSGGPVSTTSQVLNLGEFHNNKNSRREQEAEAQNETVTASSMIARFRSMSPRSWPVRLWSSLSNCCTVGELGQATAQELAAL